MVLSGLAILIVLLIAYMWMTRGFFSAFLHLLCVIAAGSIAFSVWEPVAYALLGQGGVLENSAWALGLGLPFALTLIPLRLICDKVVPANVKVANALDYVGGGLCGVVSGVITAGILVLSVGLLRLDSEFMGHRSLEYSSSGSVVRSGSLILPVDNIVAEMYGYTSQRVFSTDTPLAALYPNLTDVPTAMRMTYSEGKGRNTIRPEDFTVLGRYTVGRGKKLRGAELLRDKWSPNAQQVSLPDRSTPKDGSYIEGFALNFKPGAKDKGDGKVVVGGAQLRLVVRDDGGYEYLTLYPIASVCQAEAAAPQLARFRYDGREVFLASAGGAAESVFGFEFVVPDGYYPVALYVKNVRIMIETSENEFMKPELGEYPSPSERDTAIASNRYIKSEGAGGIKSQEPLDTSKEVKIGDGRPLQQNAIPVVEGFLASNRMQQTLQRGTEGNLVLDDKNVIIDGRHKWAKEAISKMQGVEKSLRIEKFSNSEDTVIVQLTVLDSQRPNAFNLLGPVASQVDAKFPPMLRDTNDINYLPVGWIYSDDQLYDVRYTPGEPIKSVDELGQEFGMSRSRTDQKLVLIFRVSKGVTINRYIIGNTSICLMDPTFPLIADQR